MSLPPAPGPGNLRTLFPPNTLRRLLGISLRQGVRHPAATLARMTPRSLGRCWTLLRQREFALLEDLIRFPPYAGWRSGPAPTANRPSPLSVCFWIRVTPQNQKGLSRTLDSLQRQTHAVWEGRVVTPPGWNPGRLDHPLLASRRVSIAAHQPSRRTPQPAYYGFLEAGDQLAPEALARLLNRQAPRPLPDILYADHEVRGPGAGRPFFKPDWSPELLESFNYLGNAFLIRPALVKKRSPEKNAWRPADLHDWLLQAADRPVRAVHVPDVLFFLAGVPAARQAETHAVLEAMLKRRNIKGRVEAGRSGRLQVRRALTGTPRVSILLLSAFKPPDMLQACLQSIARKTTYPNYEIILVDNRPAGSLLPGEFQVPGLKRLVYPGPFNYARMNNLAARKARGEYLVFLNDDTEVVTPDWIERLLECAQLPGAGVVGAHLRYPGGAVQHGGMFLVNQGAWARHAFRHLRCAENSAYGFLSMVRNCSAVTFACAMVSRPLFQALKGLDEHLKVECNDVDFCLRAQHQGRRNLWTPHAVLLHRELATRVTTHHPGDMAFFKRRWKTLLEQGDPYYNVNLSQDTDFYLPKGR